MALVPTINPGRETALPCPLYDSGAAGIDLKWKNEEVSKVGHGFWSVPTINRGRETALPCPLYHSGAAGIDISPNQVKPTSTLNIIEK